MIRFILAWDICNEPFNSSCEHMEPFLENTYHLAKALGVKQALGISVSASLIQVKKVEPFSDVLMIHPYFAAENKGLAEIVTFAFDRGKPLLATELCWGNIDDTERARMIKSDLDVMKSFNLGFLPHAAYESRVADLHRPDWGPLSSAGYMAFINRDGSLRQGHQIFNDY